MKGVDGKTAYELALDGGFEGTEEEWLKSLIGESAYELAVKLGFEGTEEEWITSLHGHSVPDGGTTGQLLKKNSNTDYDFSWVTLQSTKNVNVSVATSAWTADSNTYTGYTYKATVTVSGVTASNNIIVSINSTATSAQEEACISASVKCKAQAANQITLYAKSKPTVALPISVIILG